MGFVRPLFASVVLLFAAPWALSAQPAVTGSSGQWTHRGSVTITGAGFGTKTTPAPVVWDDASGTNIRAKWDEAWPNNNPVYNLDYRAPQRGINLPHNRITKYIAGAHGEGLGANLGYAVILIKNRTIGSYPAYTYSSWYQRFDDAWVFGDDNNIKTFAYSIGTGPYETPNNWYLGFNTPWPDSRTSGASYGYNDDSAGVSLMTPDMNGHNQYWDPAVNPTSGVWTKVEMEVKYTNQTDGYIKLWENGVLRVNYAGPTDRYAGTARTEGIGGYARMYNQPTNWRYFADVYLDYSRSRVVLGNAPTLAASTRREVQIPTSWSGNSITLSANLGGFANGQTAYVYVFDANGNANGAGFPITVGGSATAPPPDTTPPFVSSTAPASGVSGVSTSSTVSISFNEPMTPASITTATVQLRTLANVVVAASVNYDSPNNRVVLTPSSPLVASTTYSLNVAGGASGVKDASANALPNDYSSSFTTAAAPPPTNGGLVAAFGFSENIGTIAGDSSGTNNNGTITAATWTPAGRFGPGLSFNGASSWVTIPHSCSLLLPDAFTLEAWVNPTALGGWNTVLLKEGTTGLAYALYANDNAPWPTTYARLSGATSSNGASGLAPLPLNTWTHLASTYDGRVLTLYVNGTAVKSQPASGTVTSSTGALRIGGNGVWGEYFSGVLDEVRVYSRALSATEIQSDMAKPVNVDSTPPLVSSVSPTAGANNVSVASLGLVTFSEAMTASTVSGSTIEMRTSSNALVPATVTYNATTRTATVTPSAILTTSAVYTITIKGGAGGVKDAAGNALASPFTWSFTTAAPTIASTRPSAPRNLRIVR